MLTIFYKAQNLQGKTEALLLELM